MNAYYPLIARAVAGLDKSTRESRHALYGRARTTQLAQLRDFDPPPAESEITRERLALEAAIRKVEAEAAPTLRVEAQVMSPAQHGLKPVAATFQLSKRYAVGGAAVQAVSDISMRLEHGEFVAVLGRSGSGKSTLISLLGLLDRPDAGQYLFDGQDVTELDENERAFIRSRKIGFVFQMAALLGRSSALENVELPLLYAGVSQPKRRRLAQAALDRVGLSHRHDHWPGQLSGGEQQRVAIARALVNDPVMILADEPTGALDSKTAETVLALFDELNREGRTIVIVTHDLTVAQRTRRRIRIHDGTLQQDQGSDDLAGVPDMSHTTM
jgi:putative ABC transport system ATP-binding protein